jgi:hypothetical protein
MYIQIKCTECDEGLQMYMVCYGDAPVEKYKCCKNCDGTGQIEYKESEYIIAKLKGEL